MARAVMAALRAGEAIADRLVEGERALRDTVADAADDDGLVGGWRGDGRRRLAMSGIDPVLAAALQHRDGRRRAAPSSRMRIWSASWWTSTTRRGRSGTL